MHTLSLFPGVGAEIAAFLLAASCAGCDTPGRLLCEPCRGGLAAAPRTTVTPGGLTVHAALGFEAVAARCIRRLKSDGETHLSRPLSAALATVLMPLVSPSTWIVPVPTSRGAFRRRGYRVPELLARRAGGSAQRALSTVATSLDQRGLGIEARAHNVRDSMRARRPGRGAEAVLVDDVVTTGATLDEAARALGAAGFRVSGAAALAATPRRSGF